MAVSGVVDKIKMLHVLVFFNICLDFLIFVCANFDVCREVVARQLLKIIINGEALRGRWDLGRADVWYRGGEPAYFSKLV